MVRLKPDQPDRWRRPCQACLLMAESKEKARDQASGLIYLLECLGFTINSEKTISEPIQILEFLGFTVNTVLMELSLPPGKIKTIRAESRKLLEAEQVSARALSRLIGKMNATNQVIPPAPLFYRYLQMDLKAALRLSDQDYETFLSLSPGSKVELVWWDSQMIRWNGKTVLVVEPDMVIESDASNLGWGAFHQGVSTGGPMVSGGNELAYKLPRTASGNPSSADICEEQETPLSPPEGGQYHGGGLHQQPRGDSLEGAGCISQGLVDVVSGEEYPYPGTVPPRDNEFHSRPGVESDERQVRLATRPPHILQDQSSLRPTRSGPVCIKADQSVPPLFQLAARSVSRSDRCLPTGLVRKVMPTPLATSLQEHSKRRKSRGQK